MKKIGWIIVFASLFLTVNLWVISKVEIGVITDQPLKSLGQITGLLGAVLISIEYLLAARVKFIEHWFGGLDRVYRAHRYIGGAGFALIVYHPLFLAIHALPNMKMVSNLFIPSTIWSYTYGILALYTLFALMFITIYVKLPYRFWKMTHVFMGIPLAFMVLHMWFISSDTSNSMPLRIWMLGLAFFACGAYIYKRFLYTRFGPRFEYEVVSVSCHNGITDVSMKPLDERMHHDAGQFAFIAFENKWLTKEKHPFTIASSPDDEYLRFAIKSLGDFTSLLEVIRVGDKVHVYGPYGEFGEKAIETKRDQIWIAGGIGVTPFLSLARYLNKKGGTGAITLFYCTKNEEEAMYLDELKQSESGGNIKIINFCSETSGRLNVDAIIRVTGDPKNKLILLCGPGAMTSSLAEAFNTQKKVPRRNILFEEFSFIG